MVEQRASKEGCKSGTTKMGSHLDMMSDELQWPSQFPVEAQPGKHVASDTHMLGNQLKQSSVAVIFSRGQQILSRN